MHVALKALKDRACSILEDLLIRCCALMLFRRLRTQCISTSIISSVLSYYTRVNISVYIHRYIAVWFIGSVN